MSPIALILICLVCAGICFFIAKQRGANTTYWVVMGFLVGPLAIPFVFFARKSSSNL